MSMADDKIRELAERVSSKTLELAALHVRYNDLHDEVAGVYHQQTGDGPQVICLSDCSDLSVKDARALARWLTKAAQEVATHNKARLTRKDCKHE